MLPICRSTLNASRVVFPPERLPFDHSLYLIANRPSFQDEKTFFLKVMQSVEGGVSCVQYRDYESDLSIILKSAARLRKLLKGVSFFINTRNSFEVALSTGADGVYLEEKFTISEARKLLGQKLIIGIPVKTVEEILALGQTPDIDYLSVKVGLSTRTCTKNYAIVELEQLRKIYASSPYKIILTGGQSINTVKTSCSEFRGVGYAMASALTMAADPCKMAQEIRESL